MALGAYSVVRYSDNASDQRVNLGVLVWHPTTGFLHRFSHAVDRVKVVNPRAQIQPLREQIVLIESEMDAAALSNRNILEELSRSFRDGLEVSAPYPARINSADAMLDRLYEMLVSPVPEIRRAGSQRNFEKAFGAALKRAMGPTNPRRRYEPIPPRKVEGVTVTMGVRTMVNDKGILWRPLSLQSIAAADKQLQGAKAAALDILTVRGIPEFEADKQIVALQQPKSESSDRIEEVFACLNHVADDVLIGADASALAELIPSRLELG
jgi:hypothetical protein